MAQISFVVNGVVLRDGQPAGDVTVRAVDIDFRREELLGEATTDAQGRYSIQYTHEKFARREKGSADVLIRVYDGDTVVATSPILFNAPQTAELNLTLPPAVSAVSEFTRVKKAVLPLIGRVLPADFTADDLAFLAGETGIQQFEIECFASAHRAANTWPDIPVEVFYGLMRVAASTDPVAFLNAAPDTIRGYMNSAIEQHIISASFERELGAIVAALQRSGIQKNSAALSPILEAAQVSLDSQLVERLVTLARAHFGTAAEFWANLANEPGLGSPDTIAGLKQSLRLAALTDGRPALLSALQSRVGTNYEPSALASLTSADVRSAVEQSVAAGEPLPSDAAGDTQQAQIESYAGRLALTIEGAFPTQFAAKAIVQTPAINLALARAVLQANLGLDVRQPLPGNVDLSGVPEPDRKNAIDAMTALRDEARFFPALDVGAAIPGDTFVNPIRAQMGDFFQRAQGFDLVSTNVDRYIVDNGARVFAGVDAKTQEVVTGQLRAMQRVYRVAPKQDHATALLTRGLDSAKRIHAYGRKAFLADFSGVLDGEENARFVYNAASQVVATAAHLVVMAYDQARSVLPRAVGVRTPDTLPTATSPMKADLGASDPPGADSTTGTIAAEGGPALGPMEADLGSSDPPATGSGTGTIAAEGGPALGPTYAKLFGSQDFCECGECQSVYGAAAYFVDLMQFLHHQKELPLNRLNSRRPDLQYIPLTCDNTKTELPYIDLVIEALESYIADKHTESYTASPASTDDSLTGPWEYKDAPWPDISKKANGALANAVYPAALPFDVTFETMRVFLEQLGTSRAELASAVLRDAPVNYFWAWERLGMSAKEWQIITTADSDSLKFYGYDTEPANWPVSDFLNRMQLDLGELDAILKTDYISKSSSVTRISDSNSPCDVSLMKLSGLEATDAGGLNLHRFIRLWRKLGWSVEDVDTIIKVLGQGTLDSRCLLELAAAVDMADQLSLSVADLAPLWPKKPGAPSPQAPNALRMFLRAIGWSKVDSLALADLSGLRPFPGEPGATARKTRDFVRAATRVTESGFSAAQLRYLLRHDPAVAGAFEPSNADVDALHQRLQAVVTTVEQETAETPDPSGERLRGLLAQQLDAADISRLLRIVDGDFSDFTTSPGGVVDFLEKLPFISEAHRAQLKTALGGEPIAESQDRRQMVLGDLLDYNKETRTHTLAIETVCSALGLDRPVANFLLGDEVKLASGLGSSVDDLKTLLADTVQLRSTYIRLGKIATLVKIFHLNLKEVQYITRNKDDFGGFQWSDIPVASTDVALSWNGWKNLAGLAATKTRLPAAPDRTPVDVLQVAKLPGVSLDDVVSAAVSTFGWAEADVSALAASNALNLSPDEFRNPETLLALDRAFALARNLAVPVADLITWAMPDPTAADAASLADKSKAFKTAQATLTQVTQARYSAEDWVQLAEPLVNKVRERYRDALVAKVLQMTDIKAAGVTNPNQLFEYFLIDTEMSSCMKTSRIKQAISSVQLFIQRCFLNLETDKTWGSDPGVSPSDLNAEWWEWMKAFRVWEANRQVFLYPENWIYTDLRDDKTPFFKELESELLQSALSDDDVETAFANYLHKLHRVARLQICGVCKDPDQDVLHVFGRTTSDPKTHYYRRREGGIWTAWEELTLDLPSDDPAPQLLPLVINSRLYLFWPTFVNQTNTDTSSKTYQGWALKLAWSDYRQGRWAPQSQSSTQTYSFDPATNPPEKRSVRLSNMVLGSNTFNVRLELRFNDSDSAPTTDILHPVGVWKLTCGDEPQLQFHTQPSPPSPGPVLALTSHKAPKPANSSIWGIAYKGSRYLALSTSTNGTQTVLAHTPSAFEVLPVLSPGASEFRWTAPNPGFFFRDDDRLYLASPISYTTVLFRQFPSAAAALTEPEPPVSFLTMTMGLAGVHDYPSSTLSQALLFETHFHPFACSLISALYQSDRGVTKLLTLDNQCLSNDSTAKNTFSSTYDPAWEIVDRFAPPVENIDFSTNGAYSLYNWELFFHIPFRIAVSLMQGCKWEQAQRWFHYIFDPTSQPSDPSEPIAKRYWKVWPLHEYIDRDIAALLHDLADRSVTNAEKTDLQHQIQVSQEHPFEPYPLARMRLTAFKKTVVMRYIDNLIAWGDNLFARDTIESINEATQLYILAYNLLGQRPETVPPPATPSAMTYAELKKGLDDFSNALVKLENAITVGTAAVDSTGTPPPLVGLYFCIPPNNILLAYWDTVEDRLYKIRHCQNISGVTRTLPLFEPPIDPALLVRARAEGRDVDDVLDNLYAQATPYRFNYLLQKALEICAELRSLGATLLTVLEKRDAEELALRRADQERVLLKLNRDIRALQIQEAQATQHGLQKTRAVACQRYQHYQQLLGAKDTSCPARGQAGGLVGTASTLQLSAGEGESLEHSSDARDEQRRAQDWHMVESGVAVLPNISWPPWSASFGGSNLSAGFRGLASYHEQLAGKDRDDASTTLTNAGYERRQEEWQLQRDLALREIDQIDKQIDAADLRIQVAQKERDNLAQQIENADNVYEFLHSKYTNLELYQWMASQTSSVFSQCYKLAYGIAKRAERAYQFELGLSDSGMITAGYWDSLRSGLLSGERLYLDLKRMELAYLDKHGREYEIIKHVSLVLHDPTAFITLKETGICSFRLPEDLYDLDFPGHYMRRIKTVSVTIPCVSGPYTGVYSTLTLLKSRIRTNTIPDPKGVYVESFSAVESIATSHAQNDSGMFELSFHDERYLPFEGAGADSTWRLELPKNTNPFDFETITDVIIRVSYTARDGGEQLKQDRLKKAVLPRPEEVGQPTIGKPVLPRQGNLRRLFSLRHEFPDAWRTFTRTDPSSATQEFVIDVADRLSYRWRGRQIEIDEWDLYFRLTDSEAGAAVTIGSGNYGLQVFKRKDSSETTLKAIFTFEDKPMIPGVPLVTADLSKLGPDVKDAKGAWRFSLMPNGTGVPLTRDLVSDVYLLCRYSASEKK